MSDKPPIPGGPYKAPYWCATHGYLDADGTQTRDDELGVFRTCIACGNAVYHPENCGCVIVNKGSPGQYEAHMCDYHMGRHDAVMNAFSKGEQGFLSDASDDVMDTIKEVLGSNQEDEYDRGMFEGMIDAWTEDLSTLDTL